MHGLKFSKSKFVKDLTATKSMSITAAAVLVATFLPITGGAIKPYELREFSAGVTALMNGETTTPSLYPARHPEWGGVQLIPTAAAETPAAPLTQAVMAAPVAEDAELHSELPDNEAVVMPVAQTFEPPPEECAEGCDIEAPMFEEVEFLEPEIESIDDFDPFEMG